MADSETLYIHDALLLLQVSTRGGLTAKRQVLRDQIRMEAAERFAAGEDSAAVAKALRVDV